MKIGNKDMKQEKLMKTLISAPKPQSLLGIDHYRDLTNLGSLIASSPETFWCYIHLQKCPFLSKVLIPDIAKPAMRYLPGTGKIQGHGVTSGDRGGYRRMPKERVKVMR